MLDHINALLKRMPDIDDISEIIEELDSEEVDDKLLEIIADNSCDLLA